ncbi:MAG: recombinase family protein [Cognatishimia sp.]
MIDDCFVTKSAHNQAMNTHHQSGRKIGYIRVSDKDQTEALQIDALNAEGCDLIFSDHGVSGGKFDRPALDDMMKELQSGDTLTVWKLDRLGRSTIHLLQILNELRERGVNFHAITQGLDTRTAVGRMIYGQLAVFAEYERSLISERTKAGMAAAKARGVHVGRPRLSKTMKTALDDLERLSDEPDANDTEIEPAVNKNRSISPSTESAKSVH